MKPFPPVSFSDWASVALVRIDAWQGGKLMTREEEKYVHFASGIDDLNYAWRVLREIKGASDSVLVGAAFQFALVAYARPYKESRGSLRRYRLSTKFIPSEHRGLHQRILDARDKIHAHSD